MNVLTAERRESLGIWKLPFFCFPLYLSRFIPPSFQLFLGLFPLLTDDICLVELTEFPTFLRAGLFIDASKFGEKK